MADSYFQRVKATTPTRLWVNNPIDAEIDLALRQGAVGCTTNPAYGGSTLRRAPEVLEMVIDASIRETESDAATADRVQQLLVKRIADRFMPLYERSDGSEGFVSIQGSPESDNDGPRILAEAHEGHALSPNVAPKIPATLPGFHAFERLVEAGHPSIVTEVFSVSQLIYACETYIRASEHAKVRPPFFMSPITGIFGDHLKAVAARSGIQCDATAIDWAGVALARGCQRVVEERDYPVTLLFGGARVMNDFTGLVGAKSAATINYSTVAEILAADPEVADTIHEPTDPALLATLQTAFPEFRKAMLIDGLAPEEFEAFGPFSTSETTF